MANLRRNSILCVKSIMTIILTVALVALTFRDPQEYAETFKTCVAMVVTFYFSHQIEKKKGSNSNEDN